MGYSCYETGLHNRDGGYGVPAYCDHPGCTKEIDRGLAHLCGHEPGGGDFGCGLYFCGDHLWMRKPRGEDFSFQNCARCMSYKKPYKPKPEHPEWLTWKLEDESWEDWRNENPSEVEEIVAQLAAAPRGEQGEGE